MSGRVVWRSPDGETVAVDVSPRSRKTRRILLIPKNELEEEAGGLLGMDETIAEMRCYVLKRHPINILENIESSRLTRVRIDGDLLNSMEKT